MKKNLLILMFNLILVGAMNVAVAGNICSGEASDQRYKAGFKQEDVGVPPKEQDKDGSEKGKQCEKKQEDNAEKRDSSSPFNNEESEVESSEVGLPRDLDTEDSKNNVVETIVVKEAEEKESSSKASASCGPDNIGDKKINSKNLFLYIMNILVRGGKYEIDLKNSLNYEAERLKAMVCKYCEEHCLEKQAILHLDVEKLLLEVVEELNNRQTSGKDEDIKNNTTQIMQWDLGVSNWFVEYELTH